ncbi:hypothetical protein NDR87_14070 [Nocardia sp. CDC159]|uniref:Uncharacterized protein n=1 Tax=Nocardia pulmonis TaxID=2951408 RepID=A0A9X2E7U3_9NOCA|nr:MULTISPECIES: hypothetical protein [Nocardia]MCM6774450.1 hypothetical protein [Nocardia pulmonis]MCM6787484.1 hypothetical protein [Nocardia sp. CDC159]
MIEGELTELQVKVIAALADGQPHTLVQLAKQLKRPVPALQATATWLTHHGYLKRVNTYKLDEQGQQVAATLQGEGGTP